MTGSVFGVSAALSERFFRPAEVWQNIPFEGLPDSGVSGAGWGIGILFTPTIMPGFLADVNALTRAHPHSP